MTNFTTEELTKIARDVGVDCPEVIERDGLRFTFGQEYDDQGVIEHVNDCDAYGKLGWPEPVSRWDPNGQDGRPDGFTGAARKFGATPMHDTIWWEPYREGRKVYDDPDTVRFMRELLDWGFIGVTLKVERRESCGYWHEAAFESLWGIESPLCHTGNEGYEYLAEVYSDLIHQALHELEAA
jgi:hypothetical protein